MLGILCSNPFNLNKITKIKQNISWPIKNFEKYFMVHQYMPKIFHDPTKTIPPPSYILNVRSLMWKQLVYLLLSFKSLCIVCCFCYKLLCGKRSTLLKFLCSNVFELWLVFKSFKILLAGWLLLPLRIKNM